MSHRSRHYLALAIGLLVLALLIGRTLAASPLAWDWLAWLIFVALVILTTTFGIHFIGLVSLLPMTSLAALLVLGLLPAAWAAFVGALLHSWVRFQFAKELGGQYEPGWLSRLGLTAVNAAMQMASVWLSGQLYHWAGGITPLGDVRLVLWPISLAGLTYLAANFLIAGFYVGLRGREPLRAYLSALPQIVLLEGIPLVLSPLMALIYLRLGLGQFFLFAILLLTVALITRRSWRVQQGLERRVNELHSLQAVGKALSASLDLSALLDAIHQQVARLMPAENFYVALYNADADEVAFPLVLENSQKKFWRSRRTGQGFTEYVIRTRAPLLMRRDIDVTARALGVTPGKPAQCWLGAPLLAGDEVLGMMAVQSYDLPDVYDDSHRELLTTIAVHAAVAVQNARLYGRTDEALARRVQELDSILRTVRDGVLLFDPDWRAVAANRAFADFVGLTQSELAGQRLLSPGLAQDPLLIERLGYTLETLRADCQALAQNEVPYHKQHLALPHAPGRRVARTLAPVRSREGLIDGWLLVLHDVTEEHELTRLRDEMTYMLVHDLRAPLSVLISSLDTLDMALAEGQPQMSGELLKIARQGGGRLLLLVNTLLDINKLESGQMLLLREPTAVETLLREAAARLTPAAENAHIALTLELAPDLPVLNVDNELLGRVLTNLLDNALKFTPDYGQVRLWAKLGGDATSVLIGVADSGPGIPAEAQARLFKKFQQVTVQEGRRRGTGLGLAFCKLVVEAHGGRIWVESEAGRSATFVMSLPLTRPSTSAADPPP
jgi:PAS domain S-box-containing protein